VDSALGTFHFDKQSENLCTKTLNIITLTAIMRNAIWFTLKCC